VSSLSDPRVIDTLRQYFVAVWISRDSYQTSPRSKEEQKELNRIDQDRRNRKLPGGTVSLVILAPDGAVRSSLDVHASNQPDKVVAFLREAVEQQKAAARTEEQLKEALKHAQLPSAKAPKGGAVLNVWTRLEGRRKNFGIGESWVPLTAEDCKAFLPEADAKPGAGWDLPAEVVERLCKQFYPPAPNWRDSASKLGDCSLRAELVSRSDDEVRLRLTGAVEVNHPFGVGLDGKVTAHLVGYAEVGARSGQPTSFVLVGERAQCVWQGQARDRPEVEPMSIAVGLVGPEKDKKDGKD
jgi:hypothetical protein